MDLPLLNREASPHSIESEELIYSGWSSLSAVTARTAEGRRMRREIEHHGSAVAVLPYDWSRRKALLVSLPRVPVIQAGRPDLLEAAAGLVDEGESVEEAVRREAFEELGLELHALEPVGQYWSIPSVSTERVDLFLAPYSPANRVHSGGGLAEEDEYLLVHEIDLSRLILAARTGGLNDMKTALLAFALRDLRPELFEA
jgi:nudix-type nucleoside diphosphatase (YffH/AdpP family)